MAHSRADVLAAVRSAFPEGMVARVVSLLDAYGTQPYERDRVHLAILALSHGNEEKLREYIEVAKRDYRDVLFWAEYPEEATIDTPEKKRAVRELLKRLGLEPPDGLKD